MRLGPAEEVGDLSPGRAARPRARRPLPADTAIRPMPPPPPGAAAPPPRRQPQPRVPPRRRRRVTRCTAAIMPAPDRALRGGRRVLAGLLVQDVGHRLPGVAAPLRVRRAAGAIARVARRRAPPSPCPRTGWHRPRCAAARRSASSVASCSDCLVLIEGHRRAVRPIEQRDLVERLHQRAVAVAAVQAR